MAAVRRFDKNESFLFTWAIFRRFCYLTIQSGFCHPLQILNEFDINQPSVHTRVPKETRNRNKYSRKLDSITMYRKTLLTLTMGTIACSIFQLKERNVVCLQKLWLNESGSHSRQVYFSMCIEENGTNCEQVIPYMQLTLSALCGGTLQLFDSMTLF